MSKSRESPTTAALDDPVVARLVDGVCYACQEILKLEHGVFAMAFTIDATSCIGVAHISMVDSVASLDGQRNVEVAITTGLASGRFQAVAFCLNIAHPGIYEPGAIPVLAIRVLRTPGQPIDLRVPYKVGPDRTIDFEQPRIVAGPEDMRN